MKRFKRILLKLSGEALEGNQGYGIDPSRLEAYAHEIESVRSLGVEVAVVMGGGNIYRGLQGTGKGMDRVQGDYMGMLATVINSMALQETLERKGIPARILSTLTIQPVVEPMNRRTAVRYLEEGKVVLIAGGTGNPFFTTDSAAALRALEINADAILKGTRVDGIYTADPEKDPAAKRYDQLTFSEAMEKGLKVMDLTAFALCRENKLPIIVFNMNIPGNLKRVTEGEPVGTVVQE